MLLGCIGDDFTGSSDLANMLVKEGMRVTQYAGIPDSPAATSVEAGVVSLKSRTIAPADAIVQSLAALDWLRAQGCRQFFFKYCSTFDSTREGNIGPVADALINALDAEEVIVCPVFPATGRTLYQGHLFVNGVPLSESGMENHPLTPMTDSDIRRWLGYQSRLGIGHVGYHDVAAGWEAIQQALRREHDAGKTLIVVDAIRDADLYEIGKAVSDATLLTGGSGIALGLPGNFRDAGLIGEKTETIWRGVRGLAVILSGSCSAATRAQVDCHAENHPALMISAQEVMSGARTAANITNWLLDHMADLPLAYTSADPDVVKAAQALYGIDQVAGEIEAMFSQVAVNLANQGVARIISAGGETSGAIVTGLHITAMEVGPEIDPGVPALKVTGRELALALKSGNFGGRDFFAKAALVLEGGGHE